MVFAPQGKHTLSHRVFVTIFVCAMAVIVAFTVLGAFFVQNTLADATSANLAQETELIAAALDEQQEPIPFLRSLDREDLRITLINKDGSVAYDNEASPSTLPNHGDRPEVIEAFENGSGSAERASSTLDEIMLYRAVALDNGQVVRLAQAQPGVAAILLSMVAPMLLIAAAGAVLSFFMARRESRAIIAPLQEVDLDHPRRSYEHAYAEMVPMLERIESQRQELKRQMAVLADNDRMRREFTANVSHELKTPLQSIMGSAELIENGLVKPEDMPHFIKNIRTESARLVALIEDIIRLSRLDEGVEIPKTEVDLLNVATETAELLRGNAEAKNVSVKVHGKSAVVFGVDRLIYEIAYNLCENAVKYNIPGGAVDIGVDARKGKALLTVRDTGIGIPKEQQSRVFERFYRVDKSRSKDSGGTGLGLSIVKHAAAYHNAELTLESVPGKGTCVTVAFPLYEGSENAE